MTLETCFESGYLFSTYCEIWSETWIVNVKAIVVFALDFEILFWIDFCFWNDFLMDFFPFLHF